MATRLIILGSTGSIGKSALKVVRNLPGRFEVVGLAARSNVTELERQIREFHPRWVAVDDEAAARQLAITEPDTAILSGAAGIEELAGQEADIVLCGIVGAAGLRAVLAAIDAGTRVALANKEPLVMAGQLIIDRARSKKVPILPVDSEHNALFQCMHGHDPEQIHAVYLTASGGPFYGRDRASLERVTAEEAVNHPTWDMGEKISIDSATLMNKGLEIIEAHWLFGLPLEKIRVVIHPQSIVHGLVEFIDGTILAHMGVTDMTLPIQFALTWPERVESPLSMLNLTEMGPITFAVPDFVEFPCLELALEAAREGGTAPAILNAANEIAVNAFREGRLPFLGIAEVVRQVLHAMDKSAASDLESILAADAAARDSASQAVSAYGVKFA